MRNRDLKKLTKRVFDVMLFTVIVFGCIGEMTVNGQSKIKNLSVLAQSYEGLVSAPYDFICRGGRYKSTISIGVLETSLHPTIYLTYNYPYYDSVIQDGKINYQLIGDNEYQKVSIDRNGKGIHTKDCYELGGNSYGGLIHYSFEDEDIWIPFSSEYIIGDWGFELKSILKNTLFRGVDNYIYKDVIGYNIDDMHLSTSDGGTIIKADGEAYIVNTPKAIEVETMNIAANIIASEGKKSLGGTEFRVYNVPHPTVMIAGEHIDGSILEKGLLLEKPYLTVYPVNDFLSLDDNDFEIISYCFMFTQDGSIVKHKVIGAQFTQEILEDITSMSPNTLITFTDVLYSGPSGKFKTNGVSVIVL